MFQIIGELLIHNITPTQARDIIMLIFKVKSCSFFFKALIFSSHYNDS